MAFVRKCHIGNGFRLTGNDKTIDILVSDIKFEGDEREAVLKVLGIPDLREIHLNYLDKGFLVDLADGIRVGLAENFRKGKCGARQVSLVAIYPENYQIQVRNYN